MSLIDALDPIIVFVFGIGVGFFNGEADLWLVWFNAGSGVKDVFLLYNLDAITSWDFKSTSSFCVLSLLSLSAVYVWPNETSD